MSLKDTFARGFVWKLAGLLAILIVSFVMTGEAKAQDYTGCYGNVPSTNYLCPDREAAYSNAKRVAELLNQHPDTHPTVCTGPTAWSSGRAYYQCTYRQAVSANATRHYYLAQECPTGKSWNEATKKCEAPCDVNAPNLGPRWVQGTAGAASSSICNEGCEYVGNLAAVTDQTTLDGIVYTRFAAMTPWGTTCTTGEGGYGTEVAAPPSDSDGDGSSDGQDSAPNNPGQGAGGGDDPTGEDDQPGEGSGNGNTSGGGGDCGTPPNSQGDQIAAQIAYQTWATRCAIEAAKDESGNLKTTAGTGSGTGSGSGSGSGTGLGTCAESEVGTALCTMKEAIAGIKGFFDGIGEEAGTLDTSEGETEDPESVWADQSEAELDLDASGFGFAGGGCPAPPSYMGNSLDPGGYLCMFASLIGALVLAAGYVQAGYIIGRA